MSRSLNKVMLIGNLGSDPEIRTTGGGNRVAQFSLATNRSWTDRNGQQQEKTEWHRVVCWDKLADIVEKFVKKGDRLYVEGAVEYRSYEDKDGITRYVTEIRAREMMMLSGRGEGSGDFDRGGGERYERGGGRPAGAAARSGGGAGGGAAGAARGGDYDDFQAPAFEEDDDLPF